MSSTTENKFSRAKIIKQVDYTLDRCVIDSRALEIQRQNTRGALTTMQNSLALEALMSALKNGISQEIAREIFNDVKNA